MTKGPMTNDHYDSKLNFLLTCRCSIWINVQGAKSYTANFGDSPPTSVVLSDKVILKTLKWFNWWCKHDVRIMYHYRTEINDFKKPIPLWFLNPVFNAC